MSQAPNLPKIKRIELPSRNLKPYPGATVVGQLPDGTPIWEGEIPATNPYFIDHTDPKDNGHKRTAMMDPERPGKERWRRNKNGEPITKMTRNKRLMRFTRYIMVDDGSAGAGPRPVPDNAQEMTDAQKLEASMPEFQRQVMLAARKSGMTAQDVANALAKLAGVDPDDDEAAQAHFPVDLETPLPEPTHTLDDGDGEPEIVDAVDENGDPVTLSPEVKAKAPDAPVKPPKTKGKGK